MSGPLDGSHFGGGAAVARLGLGGERLSDRGCVPAAHALPAASNANRARAHFSARASLWNYGGLSLRNGLLGWQMVLNIVCLLSKCAGLGRFGAVVL